MQGKWADELYLHSLIAQGTRGPMKLDNCSKPAAKNRITGVSYSGCCVAAHIEKQLPSEKTGFEMSVWVDGKFQVEPIFRRESIPP